MVSKQPETAISSPQSSTAGKRRARHGDDVSMMSTYLEHERERRREVRGVATFPVGSLEDILERAVPQEATTASVSIAAK